MDIKPIMTQAYRPGQNHAWTTDSRHSTVEEGIAAAKKLVEQFGRTVRVIDQNEKVHFRLGTIQAEKKRQKKGCGCA